jgi:hypothetical protein
MSMHPDPVGDLEYDLQQYPRAFEPLLAGKADVVIGSRFMGGKTSSGSFLMAHLRRQIFSALVQHAS